MSYLRRSARPALAILFAVMLKAQAAPEDCDDWAGHGVHIDPIVLAGIEFGRDLPMVPGVVVAEEIDQIAERGWVLAEPMAIPEERLTFPAGTPLVGSPLARARNCLPDAPDEEEDVGAPRRSQWNRLACLVDGDGDGRHEQVRIFRTNHAMHVPQARLSRTLALSAPARLAPDPLGEIGTRRRVHRRVMVGGIEGDEVRLVVAHALGEPDRWAEAGRWEALPVGGLTFRPAPILPVPIDRREAGWHAGAETRVVKISDGSIVEVGGARLRIDRAAESLGMDWRISPRSERFPRWIHYGCGGRSIRLGAAPGPQASE